MTEAILERKKGQLGLPKGDFGMAEETRVLKEQEEGVLIGFLVIQPETPH